MLGSGAKPLGGFSGILRCAGTIEAGQTELELRFRMTLRCGPSPPFDGFRKIVRRAIGLRICEPDLILIFLVAGGGRAESSAEQLVGFHFRDGVVAFVFGGVVAFGHGLREPKVRFLKVHRNSRAVRERVCERHLSADVVFLAGLAKKGCGIGHVLRHPSAVRVQDAEIVLRRGIVLVGGALEPFRGLRVILRDPCALGIKNSQIELRSRVILLGGFAEPMAGHLKIAGYFLAIEKHHAQPKLRSRSAFLGLDQGCLDSGGSGRGGVRLR